MAVILNFYLERDMGPKIEDGIGFSGGLDFGLNPKVKTQYIQPVTSPSSAPST